MEPVYEVVDGTGTLLCTIDICISFGFQEQEMFPGKAAGIANRLGKLFNGQLEQGRGYLVGGKVKHPWTIWVTS